MGILEERRNHVFDLMNDNSVSVIFAGTSKVTSEDEYYRFVVNPTFFYLTGIKQENSILLLIKSVNGNFAYLYVDEYSELKEKWTGRRLTYQEARDISGISSCDTNSSFKAIFDLAFAKENNPYGKINTLYVDQAIELKLGDNYYITDYMKKIEQDPLLEGVQILNFRDIITPLRSVKAEDEIECVKEAIEHTRKGILDLLTFIKPGMEEYRLSDKFEYYEKCNYREGLAFPTIAAGGKNATCLHYPSQQDKLNPDDLILLDLGYKHLGYSADITRTFPISGKFNDLQKKIYSVVLGCNKAVIDYARSGLTLKDLQEFATNFLKEGCINEGLMDKDDDIHKYYYHGVSHHLGLDTHDISDRNEPLKPGSIITVEPGLYFANYGIGVRIEDDVLITDGKAINLSKDIIKEVDDIEKLLATLRK